MKRAEVFRSYAGECLQIAEIVSEPSHRAHLIEMAQQWRELAQGEEASADQKAGTPSAFVHHAKLPQP
jgi:hypothetical protein